MIIGGKKFYSKVLKWREKRLLILLGTIFLVLAVLVLNSVEAQAKPIQWRIQTMFAAGVEDQKFFAEYPQGFCQLVKKMSGGRLIIKPYSSGELVPMMGCFESVGKGVIEGYMAASAYWAGKVPVAAFGWGPPFSIHGQQAVDTYLWEYEGGVIPLIREAYKRFNVHCVAIGSSAGDAPLFSKKPVYKVADYKGLKARCIGMAAEVLTKAGAAITYLPSPEIYSGLESGVIDAANWGGVDSMVDLGFHEVTDYILFPPLTGMVTDELSVNMDAWNALPDDLKAIVERAAFVYITSHGRWLQLRNKMMLKKLVEAGKIKVCTMPPEEAAKLTAIAIDVMRKYSKKDAYTAEAFKKLEGYFKVIGIIK